jgi:hypothetical protein
VAGKEHRWRAALVLGWGLLLPATAAAGPYLGNWGWCWHQGRDCPRGEYSPLHYWAPTVYRVRACIHPSNLDQYPPGPCPPVPAPVIFNQYRCIANPPAPTAPYADPAGYYGLQTSGPFNLDVQARKEGVSP